MIFLILDFVDHHECFSLRTLPEGLSKQLIWMILVALSAYGRKVHVSQVANHNFNILPQNKYSRQMVGEN